MTLIFNYDIFTHSSIAQQGLLKICVWEGAFLTLIEACYLSLPCDRKEKYNPVSYAIMILTPGNCLTFRHACKNMCFDVSTSVDFFFVLSRNVWTRQIEGYDTTQSRWKVFKIWGAGEGSKKVIWRKMFCFYPAKKCSGTITFYHQ